MILQETFFFYHLKVKKRIRPIFLSQASGAPVEWPNNEKRQMVVKLKEFLTKGTKQIEQFSYNY